MCDYSLQCVKTRLAKEGEQLFIHKFYTGSKGLASVDDWKALDTAQPAPPGMGVWGRFQHWLINQARKLGHRDQRSLPAVCIPPGARLHVNGIPARLQERYGVGVSEDVVFAQLSLEAYQYRDAVRFRNGQEVLLQYLDEGLQVHVISLASAEEKQMATSAAEGYYSEEPSVVFSSTENRVASRQARVKARLFGDGNDL